MVRNGDVIKFNGEICKAEIQGSEGTYAIINGKCVNVAEGINGYLTNLETGYHFRATWSETTEIVKEVFSKDEIRKGLRRY